MATKKKTQMALAKMEDLLPDDLEFDELAENLDEMDEINFPRISFRNGNFKFTDDDKGTDSFKAVIFFHGRQNTYWGGGYDPNNVVPPECFSVDGKTGSKPRDSEGRFGTCHDCKLNQFGTGIGKGKACRNQKKLYLQVPGNAVPYTLFLSPTSLGNFNDSYIMNKIVQKGLQFWAVVTTFTAYQRDNDTFYRISFEVDSVFKGDEKAEVKKLRDFWLPAIKRDRTRLEVTTDDDSEGESNNTRTVEPRKPSAVTANTSTDEVDDANDDDDDDPPF